MVDPALILKIFIFAVPILFAITLHEVAHGWMAKQLGDQTAAMLGRLTVNPFKHIDPIGTVLVPAILFLLGGTPFGWAKPVPVNWKNLKKPKRDMALVAMAGPAANLAMLFFWALVINIGKVLVVSSWGIGQFMIYMGEVGILINSILMILNLFPIPPLDGSRVVSAILPNRWAIRYARIEPYGILIVLLLFISGYLFKVLQPLVFGFQDLIYALLVV